MYQQELQPALSLYNGCAICERPTFWSEPTHLTQTQGADMQCVDSRDGMSTSFLVCPSIIQCAEPNLGQDGRKALALALAWALAESTRMQPLNDILRARQPSEPKCRATESVSRDPEARPKRRGLWSQCRSLLLRTVLAVSQCECDFGRRRWRACSFPFTDRIGNGFHSTRYMCSGFYGPRLSSRRKPVDNTKRLRKINSSSSCRCPGR